MLLIVIIGFVVGCSPLKRLQKKPIGLINNVSYKDSKFNNANASNGFLVQNEGTTYAVTAKHILMIAKTDQMQFVDFKGELNQWKMHPKNDSANYIVVDKLLNTNQKDSLTWNYMDTHWDTYNDWLVFSIKENNTNFQPLKIRKDPLTKGESLFAIGWSYADKSGSQRVYEYKFDETDGIYHNLIQVNGPESLGGLSGSPIVDKEGKVVGLVSSGWEDEESKTVFLQATNIENAFRFISKLNE